MESVSTLYPPPLQGPLFPEHSPLSLQFLKWPLTLTSRTGCIQQPPVSCLSRIGATSPLPNCLYCLHPNIQRTHCFEDCTVLCVCKHLSTVSHFLLYNTQFCSDFINHLNEDQQSTPTPIPPLFPLTCRKACSVSLCCPTATNPPPPPPHRVIM